MSVLFVFVTEMSLFDAFWDIATSNKPEKWKVAQLFALVCTFFHSRDGRFVRIGEKSMGKSMVFFKKRRHLAPFLRQKWREKPRKSLFFGGRPNRVFGGYFIVYRLGTGSKNGLFRDPIF